MVIYPEGVWYTYRTREDVDEILNVHIVGGGRVDRLLLTPDQEIPPAEFAESAGL
jgi:(2Fe-2S) ferredoxin